MSANVAAADVTSLMVPMPETADFGAALRFVLSQEGGFVDHPADPGGRTNFGVTQRAFDRWRRRRGLPAKDVADLTRDAPDLAEFYREQFWALGKCPRLPARVALAHFDGCVNQGVGTANGQLQRAAGVEADMVIGPVTLAAVAVYDPADLLSILFRERLRHYVTRPKARRDAFLAGWLTRVLDLWAWVLP